MKNLTQLKTSINNRDKIVRLLKNDMHEFSKIVRREGIILSDYQKNDEKQGEFFRHMQLLHSGYICEFEQKNGDYIMAGCKIVDNSFKIVYPKIAEKLKQLNLI